MSWKKLVLIAIAAGGLAFATAPQSEARTFVSIGVGFPVGFGYYGYGPGYYGGYYGYPYPAGYYGYAPSVYYGGYRTGYYARPYYWHHGRRIYNGRRVYRRHR